MICNHCGNKIPDDTSWCPYCGAPAQPAQPSYIQPQQIQTQQMQPQQMQTQPQPQQMQTQPQPHLQEIKKLKTTIAIVMTICVLLIIAVIILAVLFVNEKNKNDISFQQSVSGQEQSDQIQPTSGYIYRQNAASDISSAKTIKTAVETSLCNEKTYEVLAGYGSQIILEPDTTNIEIILQDYDAIKEQYPDADDTIQKAKDDIMLCIGEKIPAMCITYALDDSVEDPACWYVVISGTYSISVFAGARDKTHSDLLNDTSNDGIFLLSPEICKEYQN